jgi:hypothetical protein
MEHVVQRDVRSQGSSTTIIDVKAPVRSMPTISLRVKIEYRSRGFTVDYSQDWECQDRNYGTRDTQSSEVEGFIQIRFRGRCVMGSQSKDNN